ncbi:XdhC family protein [Halorussus salinisoli]|uniref:XdhC family protein n=1 Tax=Halorussus salinisoli TaxID=2558242 RepID=UPI0010C235C0|nr:XdhC/CoxI family protein [Halorussus salinisoli]
MSDEMDGWSATTLSVRETLRDAIGTDAAVATVVAVEGSAYRRPGAKRVLGDESVGAITAGCLEGPVADLAERALADGPLCETFDLTGEDDSWGFGLGCNGVIDVLVEPADESFRPALERLAAGSAERDASGAPSDGEQVVGKRVALLTVVGGDHPDALVGARALVDADGSTESTDPRPTLPDDLLAAVREQAREFAAAGRSDTVEVETDRGTAAVFVDGLESVPELLVFGHGADVLPVARIARDAGFRVTVATARGARADSEQFPAAHEVVATRPSEVAEALSRPADTYAVLMSHNFVDDRLALESLLETAVPYVGLMGPRKRFEQLREAMAGAGVELSADDLDRVSTPVGLDLGGGEPTQIALSIVGEALAVSNGRDGGRLTDSEGPIHPRSELDDSS